MRKGLIIAACGAAAVLGTAGAAQAQTAAGDARAAAREAYALDQSQGSKVIELDTPKRWGLKLELRQPVTRDMRLKDVEAGAYYKVTPSLRLGGAVGLTDTEAPDQKPKARENVAPRVKMGAIFKF